ncbi:MAG: alpha-hydroxy-acid oxidizing protein, partial [Gemmatimonadota bacterium]
GGTSWARIEARRASDVDLGEVFADWGIPTPDAISGLADVEGLTVVGSGGLRTGVDMAKAIAIGADLTAMAKPFLEAAGEGPSAVVDAIRRRIRELEIAMFCSGSGTIEELKEAELRRSRGR